MFFFQRTIHLNLQPWSFVEMDGSFNPNGLHNKGKVERKVQVAESEEDDTEIEDEPDEVIPNDEDEVNKEQENKINIKSSDDNASNPGGRAPNSSTDQLEAFRQQWQIELQQKSRSREQSPQNSSRGNINRPGSREDSSQQSDALSVEDMAKAFFIQGMEAEDNGMLNEAIYFYRKALQLVPDIESKLGNLFQQSPRDRTRQDSESSVEG
ncbi:hypothetical protein EGW08_020370, partial [Elysia chlorotica]